MANAKQKKNEEKNEKQKEKGGPITLEKLRTNRLNVKIKSISPLIPHSWSAKAKMEILDKQTKKGKVKKGPRDPWMDYCESFYWLTSKPYDEKDLPNQGDETYPTPEDIKKATFGFPAVGLKCSMVTAVTSAANVTKIAARQAFHTVGEFCVIEGDPKLREDMVRLSGPGSSADLRFRPEFTHWSMAVTIDVNENVISSEQVVHLLNLAGFAVGIGDWRPERNGIYGRFEVSNS